MTSLGTYRTELESMLSTVNLTGFFTDAMKNKWINQAGRRVYNFKNWPWQEHALKTESDANGEYYEQSSRFKKGGIFRITVGEGTNEKEYDIVPWNLYKQVKEEDTGEKVSAILGNQYFIYPILTTAGQIIGTYGYLKWVELTGDSDESINDESYDESIVKLAFASALKKERRFSEANAEVQEVEEMILPRLWAEEMNENPKGYIGQLKSNRW